MIKINMMNNFKKKKIFKIMTENKIVKINHINLITRNGIIYNMKAINLKNNCLRYI